MKGINKTNWKVSVYVSVAVLIYAAIRLAEVLAGVQ